MKKTLILFVLFFSSSVVAENISDFQIEGISVGDSLLDYFSEEEIISNKKDWYKYLEKNKFITIALESSGFQSYEYVDVNAEYGDDNYIIDSMAGSIYFGKNKEIKDINHCYIKQKEIAQDFSQVFENSKKDGPHKMKHLALDPSGESFYTDIYFEMDDNYSVIISCYDYIDHLNSDLFSPLGRRLHSILSHQSLREGIRFAKQSKHIDKVSSRWLCQGAVSN